MSRRAAPPPRGHQVATGRFDFRPLHVQRGASNASVEGTRAEFALHAVDRQSGLPIGTTAAREAALLRAGLEARLQQWGVHRQAARSGVLYLLLGMAQTELLRVKNAATGQAQAELITLALDAAFNGCVEFRALTTRLGGRKR